MEKVADVCNMRTSQSSSRVLVKPHQSPSKEDTGNSNYKFKIYEVHPIFPEVYTGVTCVDLS